MSQRIPLGKGQDYVSLGMREHKKLLAKTPSRAQQQPEISPGGKKSGKKRSKAEPDPDSRTPFYQGAISTARPSGSVDVSLLRSK